MKHDLTTEMGRGDAINQLHSDFISALRKAKVRLHTDAWCRISGHAIEVVLMDNENWRPIFASGITLYASRDYFVGVTPCEMNFGSSGSFNPSNAACYWRTIHAASMLDRWARVVPIVEQYCKEYREMVDSINTTNQ